MTRETWATSNRRYLAEAVAWVRARLGGEREAPAPAWSGPAGTVPALVRVVDAFGLLPFERDLLVWCLACELESASTDGLPTFGRALSTVPGAHVRALSPLGPLRRFRLIHVAPDAPILAARLRLDERVVRVLLGDDDPDAALAARLVPAERLGRLDASDAHLVARAEALAHLCEEAGVGVACVRGGTSASRRAVAVEAVLSLGYRPAVLVVDGPDAVELAPVWERERRLVDTALVLDVDEGEATHARRLLDRIGGLVVVLSARPLDLGSRAAPAIELGETGFSARAACWRASVGDDVAARLAATFPLDEAEIAAVGEEVRASGEDPWEAARRRVRVDPAPLAERIVSAAGWDDLVLPAPTRALLREIAGQAHSHATVRHAWGMGGGGGRGDGLVALFGGASGVGKTLAAEVIANDLALDLWRLDLSAVVSKYIGETEKNLARVFDAAERACCVLLFDEADALFGKRTEVRDSHDRHANLEVSYLLQRLERYRGVAILTSNLRANVDVAFLRRFRFIVDFPSPGPEERRAIWARVFPAAVPTRGLELDRLAQLNATGAAIRSIALRAAHLAASEGAPVGMGHLLRAARADYEQRGQRVSRGEVEGWEEVTSPSADARSRTSPGG